MADRAFMEAVESGDTNTIINLLENEAWQINSVDRYGYTGLQTAARNKQHRVLEFLLELGADPNIADSDGWTALHEASFNGDYESVSILIKSGAHKSLRNKEQMNALDLSVRYGHGTITYLLCEGHDTDRGFY